MVKLIGCVAAVLILSSCDQLSRPSDHSMTTPPAPIIEVPVGKYAIIHSPQVERDTMLLDTVTGDTWQLVKLGKTDNSGMGWEFVAKIDQPPPPTLPPAIQTTN